MRNKKIIVVVALVVAVISLTIAFAAFSSTLTIRPSATVTPNANTFSVALSTSESSVTAGSVSPKRGTGPDATISGTTISGLKGNFTAPGQSTEYEFYAHNTGQYDAYLNDIIYNNISGKTVNKECIAGEGTTQSLVDAACTSIKLIIIAHDVSSTGSSLTNITGKKLTKGTSKLVTAVVIYEGTEAARADGPFTVTFGNVTLNYSSAD